MEYVIEIDPEETKEVSYNGLRNSKQRIRERFDLDTDFCRLICGKVSAVSKDASKITIKSNVAKWASFDSWKIRTSEIIDMIRGKHWCQRVANQFNADSPGAARGHTVFHYDASTENDMAIITMKRKSKLKRKADLGDLTFHSPILITYASVGVYADGPISNPKTSKIQFIGKVHTNRSTLSPSSAGDSYAKVVFDLDEGTITDITNGNSNVLNVENTDEVLQAIKDMMEK
jgi:hypothetical protein